MSGNKAEVYTVSLDLDLARKLRTTVNDRVNISIKKEQTLKNKPTKLYPAWNRICAIMDRIEDTAYYLNDLVVSSSEDKRNAFSFFHLLNYSSVLLDCINEMARIYDIDMSEFNKSSDYFNQTGSDGQGSDEKYFEFLRSICSVHPVDTTRHKRYANSDYICSPRVIWRDSFYRYKEHCDIYAVAYTDAAGDEKYTHIPIYVQQVIDYIEYRYSLLNYIVEGIIRYQDKVYEEFRQQKLKEESEFENYIDYLTYLKEQGEKRFGGELGNLIDKVILLCSTSFNAEKNCIALSKYQNALKYAIKFCRSMIQNMDYESYENNGIKYPTKNVTTTLLDVLDFISPESEEALKHDYALTKMLCLYENDSDYMYAMVLFPEVKPLLEKYVSFEEAVSPVDYSVLTEIALYLDCLTCKNTLNRNIPNDLAYRMFCYSEAEWEELLKEDVVHSESSENTVKLEELLKKYGTAFN